MLINQVLKPVFLIIMVLAGCNRPDKQVLWHMDSAHGYEAVQLTPRISKRSGIAFESILKQEVPRYVPCTGYMVIAPLHITSIPAPSAGRITDVYYPAGRYIKAGTVLASLENADFITLQQEYLEARNQFEYFKEEYTRQGELTVENATSMKKIQIARRDYQSAEVTLQALRLRLENFGICPDSVRSEKLTPTISIIADGSGVLSRMNICPGTYVDKGKTLFELMNEQTLLVKLQVHEQYIGALNPGQLVDFHLSFDSLLLHKAKLASVIREIDPYQHTATVYAGLAERNVHFISGMSVKAKIHIAADTVWMTHPRSILHHRQGDFIFVKNKGSYLRIPIQQGVTHAGMTEIIGFPEEMADSVVISGVEYLGSLFNYQ